MEAWIIGSDSSSASNVIAGCALLVSIMSVVVSILLSRRREKRGYMDEFWFREIFAPSCVEPIIVFRGEWEQKLAAIGGAELSLKQGKKLASELGADVDGLLKKVWIAKLFKGDFYSYCEEQLENLENSFVQTLGASQLRASNGNGGCAVALIDDITSACAMVLGRAASLHGTGLKIAR